MAAVCTIKSDWNAHVPDSLEGFGFVVVGASQKISLGVQDLCEWIHTGSANSDKMDMLFTI